MMIVCKYHDLQAFAIASSLWILRLRAFRVLLEDSENYFKWSLSSEVGSYRIKKRRDEEDADICGTGEVHSRRDSEDQGFTG